MTSNRSKEWEKRFDKQIEQDLLGNKPRELCLGCYECGKEISIEGVKSFIQSLLDQQRMEIEVETGLKAFGEVVKLKAELIEKVEGMKKNIKDESNMDVAKKRPIMGEAPALGYNQALSDVLQLLKEEK